MRLALKKIAELWGNFADRVAKLPAKRVDLGIATVVTALAVFVYVEVAITQQARAVFGFLDTMELRSLDARFKVRGPRPVDDRIVIVGLDEKTLQKIGSFPI